MTWTKLALLAVTLGLTLLPPLTLLDQQAAVSFERHAAYWCQAVLCVTWALALWRFLRGGRLAAQVLRLGRLENALGNHAVQVHFEVDVNYGRTGVIPMDTVAAGWADRGQENLF